MAAKLLGFCEELRDEGLAVGTSEILDAFAALEQVPWTSQADFREALAATIAKSQDDRRLFELVFERWFFRAAEAEAIDRETFTQSMSIIVKHRTDIDLVAERVGVKLADPLRTEG